MYSFSGRTYWLADTFGSLASHKSPLDRSLTNKSYQVVKTLEYSPRHTSSAVFQDLDHGISDRRPPIRWNNSAYARRNAWRWFLNVPEPFDCGHVSRPNWLVNYHTTLPMTACGPLHCVAIRHWLVYNTGRSVRGAYELAPHCTNPGRQYRSVTGPVEKTTTKHDQMRAVPINLHSLFTQTIRQIDRNKWNKIK